MQRLNFTVDANDDGMKIVDYLKFRAGLSASLIKRVKFGGVSVNLQTVTMRKILHTGDEIDITLPNGKSESVEPIYAPLDIVYEDDCLLIVNKPKSMPTHPSRGNTLLTLANAVAYYLGEPSVFRSINRLDRDTSGLVLVAKDAFSAGKLGKSMKNREIDKKYLAVIQGVPEKSRDIIDAPIEREREGEIKRVVREDGKRAITEYEVIEVLENGNSLCSIKLHTGRTHQIRVHFAYIGHPLVNDFLYGTRENDEDTYNLHCYEISFPHPKTNEIMRFTRMK